MNDIEHFIRSSAVARGIDPDIAVRVAKSEGGVTEPARVGKFNTGWSWWPFQLHYALAGKPGVTSPTVGMGEGFTALTGWQPGDPRAWRDSVRYALNRAKASGWSAWYGAAAVGISRWQGINRDHPWDAHAEPWDYEAGVTPVPVTFDPNFPTVLQDDEASCAPTALTWAMRALGRMPADNWIEQDMFKHGFWNMELGLLNHTGSGIVKWLAINDPQHYGADGYGISNNTNPISWEALVPEIDPHPPYPVLLGLPNWGGPGKGHWTGVRGFKDGRILLANPGGTGPVFGQQSLSRDEFVVRAANNASIVRVLHPDLIGTPVPTPPPPAPALPTRAEVDALIASLTGIRDRLPA